MTNLTKSETLFVLKNTTKPVLIQLVDSDNVNTRKVKFVTVDEAMSMTTTHEGQIFVDDTDRLALRIKFRHPLQISRTVVPVNQMARI
jgi:hypothetical protein